MSKSTDDLVKALDKKTSKKPRNKTAWYKTAAQTVWESRPINWLAIGMVYVAVAFTAYEVAKYYIGIPEINGVVAFVATLAVGSRAFRK